MYIDMIVLEYRMQSTSKQYCMIIAGIFYFDYTGFEVAVLNALGRINSSLQTLSKEVKALKRSSATATVEPLERNPFPLNAIEEVKEVNTGIQNDQDYKEKLVRAF